MNTGITILIGMFIFLVFAGIMVYLMYRKIVSRTATRINILNSDNTITVHKKHNIGETFNIEKDEKYVFDINAVIKRKRYYEIFYYKNVPTPIKFDGSTNPPSVSSKNLKNVMESGLLAELFGSNTLTLDNILLIIAVALAGAGAILCLLMFNQGVTLKSNPENIEMIANAVKTVIGG